MDVKSISQGGLATSGASQTISNEKNVPVKVINSNESSQNNVENKTQGKPISESEIKSVVEKMNKLLDGDNTHVEYEAHKGMWNAVIKIIDNNTDEVVTQLPAKQVVEAMENLYNSVGLIMDEKA